MWATQASSLETEPRTALAATLLTSHCISWSCVGAEGALVESCRMGSFQERRWLPRLPTHVSENLAPRHRMDPRLYARCCSGVASHHPCLFSTSTTIVHPGVALSQGIAVFVDLYVSQLL